MPQKDDLQTVRNRNELVYAALLEKIKEIGVVINPMDEMLDEADESSLDALFVISRHHYSGKGNRVVGDVVTDFLAQRHNR